MENRSQEGPPPDVVIEVENLVVGYGREGEAVLEDVSFSVRHGEVLTILGPSGCGKTTLLRALTGLLHPWEGRVRVAGEEISARDPGPALTRMRKNIGVLFQSDALLESLTIAENVALPMEELTDFPDDLIDAAVQLKLDLVGLGNFGHLMPGELSGGMRKRAGLARCIALDPQILFCDEPAAGLDPITAREVDELLLEFNTFIGVTLILVTHELGTIENFASECILLDSEEKGILAAGKLEELRGEGADSRVHKFFGRRVDHPL